MNTSGGITHDPHWHLKIDRVAQYNSVIAQTRLMLREQQPKSLVFVWYGEEGQGIEMFHERLRIELNEDLTDTFVMEIRPTWPMHLADPHISFRDMLTESFGVDSLDDISPMIDAETRNFSAKQTLVYARHEPLRSSRLINPASLKAYVEWWDHNFASKLAKNQFALLGVSFVVKDPPAFEQYIEKEDIDGLDLKHTVFWLLDSMEKITKKDIIFFLRTHNVRLPLEKQDKIVSKILQKTGGRYERVVDELKSHIKTASVAESQPMPAEKSCRDVKSYKNILIETLSEDVFFDEQKRKALPYAIKQIQVENYNRIVETGISELPVDTQWILLTGDNGFGKTAFLQTIVLALFGNRDENRILTDCAFNIAVELKSNGTSRIYTGRYHSERFTDFVAYGTSRLELQNKESQNRVSERSTCTYNLFNTDGLLLNIEYELKHELLKLRSNKDSKYETIKKTLLELLPNIHEIELDLDKDRVLYTEKDGRESESLYEPLPFEKLGDGHKSIIAMIGDMLIRFYKLQPEAESPEDFAGIAIIDELDIHLHPTWQQQLPALLSSIFPHVQFIAAVHSAIPFLGVPENSVFLKVLRTAETGIEIERIPINVKELTPNTILTSPLFEMDRLTQRNVGDLSDVRTEDNYSDVELNREIEASLKAFEESDMDFPDDLFEED